jgi:aryl-alcohol dehydrogenase-like predicted oxidoreductase
MFKAVTCAIPGAKRIKQVEENVKAADLGPLDDKIMRGVEGVYNQLIRKQVHQYW